MTNYCSCGQPFEIRKDKNIVYLGINNSVYKCYDCALEYSYPKLGWVIEYEIPITTRKKKKIIIDNIDEIVMDVDNLEYNKLDSSYRGKKDKKLQEMK